MKHPVETAVERSPRAGQRVAIADHGERRWQRANAAAQEKKSLAFERQRAQHIDKPRQTMPARSHSRQKVSQPENCAVALLQIAAHQFVGPVTVQRDQHAIVAQSPI